jgi:hypothetical protein
MSTGKYSIDCSSFELISDLTLCHLSTQPSDFPVEKESPPSISNRPTRQRRLSDRLFPVNGSNNNSFSSSDIDEEEIDQDFESLPPSHKPFPRIHIHGSRTIFKDVSGYIPPSPDTIATTKTVPSRSKRNALSGPPSSAARRHLSLAMKPVKSVPPPAHTAPPPNGEFQVWKVFLQNGSPHCVVAMLWSCFGLTLLSLLMLSML